jgi:DNA replicative helicase MCM subunit Mcm2 (Cdc46/Mcm family)
VSRTYRYAKCGHKFRVHADLEQGGVVEMPTKCPSSEFAATGQSRCKSTRFNFVEGSLICSDYQEIRIQEKPQSLGVGSIPRQICVLLQHDLVDKCKAGDEAVICGIVLRRWQPLFVESRCNIELVLLANSVLIRNSEGESGGTFCGYHCVKILMKTHTHTHRHTHNRGRGGTTRGVSKVLVHTSTSTYSVSSTRHDHKKLLSSTVLHVRRETRCDVGSVGWCGKIAVSTSCVQEKE